VIWYSSNNWIVLFLDAKVGINFNQILYKTILLKNGGSEYLFLFAFLYLFYNSWHDASNLIKIKNIIQEKNIAPST
jgi:hypothetical protein